MRNLSTILLLFCLQLVCVCVFAKSSDSKIIKITRNVHFSTNTTKSICTVSWLTSKAVPTKKLEESSSRLINATQNRATRLDKIIDVYAASSTILIDMNILNPTTVIGIIAVNPELLISDSDASSPDPIQKPKKDVQDCSDKPEIMSCNKCVLNKTTHDSVCEVCYSYFD